MDRNSILAIIIEKIRLVVPDLEGRAIRPDMALADLGLDSVERHEVVVLTLEAMALDMPLVQLRGPRNIGELASLLHAKAAA